MNIVNIKGKAVDPDIVIDSAKGEYESVLILGWDRGGVLDARASLNLQAKDILWLMEVFKKNLLNGDYLD